MRKFLPLFLILIVFYKNAKADCNPAFTVTVAQATVQVHAGNTGAHLLHRWNFSGALLFGPVASFTYYAPGTYTITHRVVDSVTNCEDSVQQTVVVNFTAGCSASFTTTTDSFQYNRYTFHSTSTFSGSPIYLHYWIIDGDTIDNNYSSNLVITLAPGNHTVCLSVYSYAGCNSSVCNTISVPNSPPCLWTASFSTANSPSNPRQISFFPSPSMDGMLCTWLFGDGLQSTEKFPVHTYSQAGNYDVILRIYHPASLCFDTIIQQVQVHGLPPDSCTASFTYYADSSHPGQIHFVASSNQAITSQSWLIYPWSNLGDSIVIHANNPTYTFTDTGTYMACVTITTNTGCRNWYCWSFDINNVGGRYAGRLPSYPNPATNTVSFRVRLNAPDRIGVIVYNLSGHPVHTIEKQGTIGSNEITIPVHQLLPGQYIIDIKYGSQQKRSIFQKM